MQSRKELAAIIGAFVYSGVVLNLLTELKTILANWAYTAIVVSVVVLIISASFRIGFEDLIERLWANIKRRRALRKERELVRDWMRNWGELADLVEEVSDIDGEPSGEDQMEFSRLRFWFIHNRAKVLPLWQTFDRHRTVQAHEDYDSIAAKDVLHDHWEDPFSCFYDIYSISKLKRYINRHYGDFDEVRWVLSKLTELAIEFVSWHRSRYV
jgi:hypothetical protein